MSNEEDFEHADTERPPAPDTELDHEPFDFDGADDGPEVTP